MIFGASAPAHRAGECWLPLFTHSTRIYVASAMGQTLTQALKDWPLEEGVSEPRKAVSPIANPCSSKGPRSPHEPEDGSLRPLVLPQPHPPGAQGSL